MRTVRFIGSQGWTVAAVTSWKCFICRRGRGQGWGWGGFGEGKREVGVGGEDLKQWIGGGLAYVLVCSTFGVFLPPLP